MAVDFRNIRNTSTFKRKEVRGTPGTHALPFHQSHTVPFQISWENPSPAVTMLTGLNQPIDQVCFFDTETTGLSGGAGNLIFQAGLGYLDEGGLTVHQYFLSSPAEETRMLAELSAHFTRRPVVVTYNGKSFDMPLLNTRHILNRMPEPDVRVLDLLHATRFIWRHRLQGFRLGEVEQHILGIRRQGDLPGALVPGVYRDYLLGRDNGQATEILRHNLQDVVSLAAILSRIHNGAASGKDPDIRFALARKFHLMKDFDNCIDWIRRLEGGPFPNRLSGAALCLEADARKRSGDLDGAAQLWLMADTVETDIELAKYLEHYRKDIAGALNLTRRLLTRQNLGHRLRLALNHRRNRLERKAAAKEKGPRQ